jgi:DNA-directed RNA polymerase specialized sigma24 family protein
VGGIATAEEIVQDSFYRAVTPPGGGFGDSEKALAYLHRSMVNRSRLLLRTAW